MISYILKATCSVGHQFVLAQRIFTWGERVIILSIIALLFSLIFVFISELHIVNKVLVKINYKSIHDDIWQDVIDYRNGTTLRIVYDNAIYTGILAGHEEKGNDSWFILDDYIVDENGVSYKSKDIKFRSRVALNIKEAKRIELFYGDEKLSLYNRIINWLHDKKNQTSTKVGNEDFNFKEIQQGVDKKNNGLK